jgi:hypothetical protein
MPDTVDKAVNDKAPKKSTTDKLGKYKYYIIGAGALIVVIIWYFVRGGSGGSSSTSATTPQMATCTDSNGNTVLCSSLSSTSATGQAGATGLAGPRGPAGPRGKAAPKPKPKPKKKKHHTNKPPRAHKSLNVQYHNAHPGDTLTSIARMSGRSPADLYARNRHVLGTAGVVHPGMRLEL